MKAKEIGIWLSVIAIFFITTWGLIVFANSKNPVVSPQVGTPPSISKDDQVLGASDKVKAVLIEYADFQCIACKNYVPIIKQLKEEFGDDLLIAYRFFPLADTHMAPFQAAFAAGKQNKFWEMSDLIYENQENWVNLPNAKDLFTEYAKKLDLDITKFTNDYNDETTKKFITDQMNSGISIGITYTPTFFLNGERVDNPQSYEAFKEIIQNELNKK